MSPGRAPLSIGVKRHSSTNLKDAQTMAGKNTPTDDAIGKTLEAVDRRRMMRRAGMGIGAAAIAAAGLVGKPTPAQATNQGAGPADVDILNFALNLEYLEAEFYLYAVTGQGLAANLRTGVGVQGTTGRGEMVPFKNAAIQQYAQRIAQDELAHVTFLRGALGSAAVAIPDIDVGVGASNIFSGLAVAAGIIKPGQVFDPYADDGSFLLGAAVFEDVGVTAYGGAARFIGNPDYLEAAAAILAVEAYHAGSIRTLLLSVGLGDTFNKIATVRATLSNASGLGSAEGQLTAATFVPTDSNSLTYRRTTRQVLNIVYGTANASKGGFFPQGMNGNIKS